MRIDSTATSTRVVRGAYRGLRAAVLLAVFSLAANMILRGAVFERFGVNGVEVATLYLVGGFLAGAVVAGMQPIIKGSLTATLVASIAFLPSLLIARVMLHGSSNWRAGEILGFLVASLFLGALWGPATWRSYSDGDP